MNTPINDKLSLLKTQGKVPFHMPGHKRKMFETGDVGEYVKKTDITEITGYDNLHHPQGIIRESMDNLRKIYASRESWYLVGGSTVGILAAVSAVTKQGDRIVIARNCHKSVYNAIRLLHLRVSYFYPDRSPYDFELDIGEKGMGQLRDILDKKRDVKAVILTSPTYEGIVSDISMIRRVIEETDERVLLIVDEAHGAHMHFHDAFPRSAVECGADIVIQSTHKTLPALTQTALLHLCSDRVDPKAISDWLSVYESSSPSYVLMASAESAIIFMHNRGKKLQKYVDNLRLFRKNCGQLLHIHLIEKEDISVFDYDIGKLVLYVSGKKDGGRWLFAKLKDEWNIELEMESSSYVVAMTSVMDEEKDFHILWEALRSLDRQLDEEEKLTDKHKSDRKQAMVPASEKLMESWEAAMRDSLEIPLSQSAGKTAASFVMIYPPGIPLLVPGEKIVKEMVENLKVYLYNGYNVQGLSGDRIPVLK